MSEEALLTEREINKVAPGLKKMDEQEYTQRVVLCNAIAKAERDKMLRLGYGQKDEKAELPSCPYNPNRQKHKAEGWREAMIEVVIAKFHKDIKE